MNPVETSKAVRGTGMLQFFSIMLVCLSIPSSLAAQTLADRESVNRVVESLFGLAGDYGDEIPRNPGAWSVVVARFAKGDSREIAIPAAAGEEYKVAGATSELFGTDIDICVYSPAGDPVDCDTLEDDVPIVFFTAKTEGIYRAVMTAASVEGGGTSFAGMIVLRRLDEAAEGGGA